MARRPDLSAHQRKIVDRYYEHRDTIMLAKLGELVSEVYVAESDAARERLWKRVEKALGNLPANDARARRVLDSRDPAQLAALVSELSG